ncbi:hypothetical protein B0A48_09689 [Cryoendolithus antarcticus]|uniref:JmjC domain-containing protein n=1 Tax=Cryoendolithus antarcticus TaxID=1507870 RepID=A0A1V8T022_9PEZI|nr:hypothetical protein B0A48_09689 [Cryoendolithus antarcticus]
MDSSDFNPNLADRVKARQRNKSTRASTAAQTPDLTLLFTTQLKIRKSAIGAKTKASKKQSPAKQVSAIKPVTPTLPASKPALKATTTKRKALVDIDDNTSKRARWISEESSLTARDVDTPPARLQQPTPEATPGDATAQSLSPATHEDQTYVTEVLKLLDTRLEVKTNDIGRRQSQRVGDLLRRAEPATATDVLRLSSAEAGALLSARHPHDRPILVKGAQPLPLQTFDHFLDECYDKTATVSVQDPSVKLRRGAQAVKEVSVAVLQARFSAPDDDYPWNCLELACPFEDGLRPSFLNNEDCRLLTKLKFPLSNNALGRHSYPDGYREVEKWSFLAQAGALTEAHQDSHGYSTYITVNQGEVGFAWISLPDVEARKAWVRNPQSHTSDRWRYVVLRPGNTVAFPCGTVHSVFRLPSAGPSLCFGGHFLRCSGLVPWVKTLLEEQANTCITNEDISASAPGYLDRVEKFVRQALKQGTKVERWGGKGDIDEFLRLKKAFMK